MLFSVLLSRELWKPRNNFKKTGAKIVVDARLTEVESGKLEGVDGIVS